MPCSVEGCTGKYYARSFCGKHYQRWRLYGDPSVVLPSAAEPGEAHPRWKGSEASYSAVHLRLRRRGLAAGHTCRCGAPAQEWAYDHTDPDEKTGFSNGSSCVYSTDLDRYEPLCRPCHKCQDLAALQGQRA